MTRSLDDTIHFPPDTDAKAASSAERLDKAASQHEEGSEEYRNLVGHTPESAQADLDRAVRKSAARPTPFAQARAERRAAFDRDRAKEPNTMEETIAVHDPAFENYGAVRRSEFGRLDSLGGFVESRSDETVLLYAVRNTGKEPIVVREAVYRTEVREVEKPILDGEGKETGEVELVQEEVETDEVAVEPLECPPGAYVASYIGSDGEPSEDNKFVLTPATLYDSYRPARRGPRGRLVP